MPEDATHRMFERFSSGYYLGRLYVEPRDGDRAAIARETHQQVNEQLYTGEGVERTDLPLVMKLGTTHFAVDGDDAVPSDTLAVPEALVEETGVRNPPTLTEVFLAKADRARQILSVAEGLPTVESDAGDAATAEDERFDGFDRPGGPTGI